MFNVPLDNLMADPITEEIPEIWVEGIDAVIERERCDILLYEAYHAKQLSNRLTAEILNNY